jgi:hypothetical protein
MRILALITTILAVFGAPLAPSDDEHQPWPLPPGAMPVRGMSAAPSVPPGTTIPLFRLLNSKTGDHLYTTSVSERDSAIASFGYQSEGIAGYVFDSQAPGTTPLFRLLNPKTGDHFYTTSVSERDSAIASFGYQSEGITCYVFVFGAQAPGTIPLFRLLNPQTGHHFYTTSKAELEKAIASLGYKDEGIACQVFGSGPSQVEGRVPGITTLVRYDLAVDKVERTGPTPATVFVPTPSTILYDSTPVVVSFTFTNFGSQLVSERIAGNFGGPNFSTAYAINKSVPGSPLQGTLVLGNPPSAGPQVINLVYQELQPSTTIGAPPAWVTKTSVSQPITVISAPQFVPRAPYDLVYESVDDNGFPLNPRWGKQDKYFFDPNNKGSRDLWVPQARPDILLDCYNHAEHQDFNGINNDYDAFRNGYCKHSPGVLNSLLNPNYCQGDREVDGYQPGGPIYCASFAWKDTPWAGKCGLVGTDMNNVGGDGGFVVTFHNSGHENFGVVTYDGIVNWDNAQPEYFFDSDWCIDLYTPHGAGVTGRKDGRPGTNDVDRFVHTEFDPHNIGDQFDRGFWGSLRDKIHNAQGGECCGNTNADPFDLFGLFQYSGAVVANEIATVAPDINGHRAIVIGLLGLDVGHNDASSELHPVYGMAIHIGGKPLNNSDCRGHEDRNCQEAYLHPEGDSTFDEPKNFKDDTWAIFATNFGNEGYCSTRALHVLDGDQSIIRRQSFPTMTFRIPWAKDQYGQDMKDVDVLPQSNFVQYSQVDTNRNQETWDWAIDSGDRKGIVITFHLWPSDVRPVWFGDLHLNWTPAPPPPMAAGTMSRAALQPQATSASTKAATKQELLSTTMAMNTAQRRAFAAAVMNRPKVTAPVVIKAIVGTPNRVPPPPPPPLRPVPQIAPRVPSKAALSPGAAEEDADVRRALCAAYEGHVPNLPADFCQQNPH